MDTLYNVRITSFETETCSRCHGSGHYSQCQEYGTRCFRCAGQKITLTKRGAAARSYFDALCSKPASSLVIGDRVKNTSITHGGKTFEYIGTVTAIEKGNSSTIGTVVNGIIVTKTVDTLSITIEHEKYGKMSVGCSYSQTFKVYGPQNKENLVKALEYQATLTKQGKPRKTKG